MEWTTLVVGLTCLGLLLLVPAASQSARFLSLLESRHHEEWEALGRPSLRLMNLAESRRLRSYFTREEYRLLCDPILDLTARRLAFLEKGLGVVYWSLMTSIVAKALTSLFRALIR